MRGPTVFTNLKQEEEVEIGLQRWQFDCLLMYATDRRQDLERRLARALSSAEESLLNQQVLIVDAIISDLANQLDHEVKMVGALTKPGVRTVPAEYENPALSDLLTGVLTRDDLDLTGDKGPIKGEGTVYDNTVTKEEVAAGVGG